MAGLEEEEQHEDSKKLSLDSILGKWSKGHNREEGLNRLSMHLEEIQSRLSFKQSPRGWCYTLENEGIINKGQFDRAESAINECRKAGYLPIDFCADDAKREWIGVEEPTDGGIEDYFGEYVREALNVDEYYIPDWWEDEEYYIQMLVEKVDLKTLFEPVCERYHVPLANASGWSDINGRAQMAIRFLAAKERGQKCVLLYCGDLDPWGEKISDTLKKNLKELKAATGYNPSDLIIDRFGLKKEFIEANGLTWIDNLTTSSGKDMGKSYLCYNCRLQHKSGTLQCSNCDRKLYVQPKFVKDYIDRIGVRKCEANALVVAPEQGQLLAENAIVNYLGLESISRFEVKRDKVRKRFQRFRRQHPVLFRELESQLSSLLSSSNEENAEDDEDGDGEGGAS